MTTQPPRWTLVTVTFNSETDLQEYWSGFSSSDDVQWIVVDNASSDRSPDLAESLGARVIRLPKNLGFGGANNVGFFASQSHYVAFVNPDVQVKTETLPLLEKVIDETNGLVAPQLLNPDGSPQPNGRGAPYLLNKVLHRLKPERLNGAYRLFADVGQRIDVDWVIGAAVAGSRARLKKLGPWDDHFFVYYEDSDLGLRNQLDGHRSVVLGDARWVHGWARETTSFRLAPWILEFKSMAKFYARYPRLLGWPSNRDSASKSSAAEPLKTS